MKDHLAVIEKLLKKNNYPSAKAVVELPSSGSNRIYFRIFFEERKPILAAYNPEVSENSAWYSFTIHFCKKELAVPEIYAKDDTYQYFLLQDLGNTSLFQLVNEGIDDDVIDLYKKSIDELIRFQIKGIDGLDLDVAFPVKAFDKKSIHWDLNYFKYYFIKPHELSFDESKLENDFQRFTNVLLEADSNYFMYRDFQARNIMINNGEPWFIDFQGGRKGPLQYDLVSLLFQAKANLPDDLKNELYNYYLEKLSSTHPGKVADFEKHYNLFIYFRLMQVFGAYGFRGLIQRKGHFLASIPYAIKSLSKLIKDASFSDEYPELGKVFDQIVNLKQYQNSSEKKDKLLIEVNSFSFKKTSYPLDESENGGGFVFDCRFLPNPGRIVDLRDFNGTQQPVIEYLKNKKEVDDFLENAFNLVSKSVDNYLERGFKNLQVNFGCTGGKHRSVYSTEKLCKYLEKYGDQLTIKKNHLQKNDW